MNDSTLAASLAASLAATGPGHRFADRELLNIARLGLSRIYTAPDSEASEDMRECARQTLSRLEGWASLGAACKCCVDNECECAGRKTGSVTRTGEILASALADVGRAQESARSHMPDRSLGDFPTTWERESLRKLADTVRQYLAGPPDNARPDGRPSYNQLYEFTGRIAGDAARLLTKEGE
jgi:hypothetical protein